MEEVSIPYELPEPDNHSFFFIDQCVTPSVEAKLHKHNAWELYYVLVGRGTRIVGDTSQPFAAGDVVLLPPSVPHRWEYLPDFVDDNGCVRYLMVAFSHAFVERAGLFPEVCNRLTEAVFPAEALKFGRDSARTIRRALSEMNGRDDLGRLAAMLRLLPVLFTSSDYVCTGKPARIERETRRIQYICAYVMAHYVHPIRLEDVAAEVGMSRSAFCAYFKRAKGMTFSQFVTQYRLHTACGLLRSSQKSVSEICYLVGYNDVPHFVRTFSRAMGMSPSAYRKTPPTPPSDALR